MQNLNMDHTRDVGKTEQKIAFGTVRQNEKASCMATGFIAA